jgi:hypothetical protein
MLPTAINETNYFYRIDGVLRQRLDLDLTWEGPGELTATVESQGDSAVTLIAAAPGRRTVPCWAPLRWPRPADVAARLRLGAEGPDLVITIGSRRPWTVYLLSDACADDTWGYNDLARHDHDDLMTTVHEAALGPSSRYNLPSGYQLDRVASLGTPDEQALVQVAVQEGRLWTSQAPCQLLCGAFHLSFFPHLLTPYARHVARWGIPAAAQRASYHMEAPSWSNGWANLLACCGVTLFGKSMLDVHSGSPWLSAFTGRPRLAALNVAPGRRIWFAYHPSGYHEGRDLLAGPGALRRWLHEVFLPQFETAGLEYPTSVLPVFGCYGDITTRSPGLCAQKRESLRAYTQEAEWEYPRLVDATWSEYADHIDRDLGHPDNPSPAGRRAWQVTGEVGCSWEAWVMRAAREHAHWRSLQRDHLALEALGTLTGDSAEIEEQLDLAAEELVLLGDHAWNGSSGAWYGLKTGRGSTTLNLAIRRIRLERVEELHGKLREALGAIPTWKEGDSLWLLNPLGWERDCRIRLPPGTALADAASGEALPMQEDRALCRALPAFAARRLTVRSAPAAPPAVPTRDERLEMAPQLLQDAQPVACSGGWEPDGDGRWTAGPFAISASLRRQEDGALRLALAVAGTPPRGRYSLAWRIHLPWPDCRWRAESGGGFLTPGPAEVGGGNLLGIIAHGCNVGCALSAQASDGSERYDLALGESGFCGCGGATIEAAIKGGSPLPHAADGIATRLATGPHLYWYLLSTEPLDSEQLPDQGRDRAWDFHAVLRPGRGAIDDASLYRWALGQLVEPILCTRPPARSAPALQADLAILPLLLRRRRGRTWLDLHNACDSALPLAAPGAELQDPLGRPWPGGLGGLAARAFVRLAYGG